MSAARCCRTAFPPNHNLAAAYAMSLLVVALVFVALYRRVTKPSERFATLTGKGYKSAAIDLGRWRSRVRIRLAVRT